MKTVHPGIHRGTRINHFDSDENHILKFFSEDWYITNGGGEITINKNSHYKYFLMEPTRDYQVMFNLDKEVLVLFSPYEKFEARSITVFDEIYERYSDLRLENVCCVLISKDPNIKDRIRKLVLGDPESRVIIPFSYKEFQESTNTYFLKNRFKDFFFERDLLVSNLVKTMHFSAFRFSF